MNEMRMTVQELTGLVEKTFTKRRELDKQKDQTTELQKEYDSLTFQVMDALEANGLSKFAIEAGTISMEERPYVSVPKGDDKFAFFEFLKTKEQFEALATINAQTLNKWFKENREDDPLFSAPGLGLPSQRKIVKLRRS